LQELAGSPVVSYQKAIVLIFCDALSAADHDIPEVIKA
jgi:hypothetical protein